MLDTITRILEKYGCVITNQTKKSVMSECPKCGRSDKFYIRKSDGKCVCFHGSCQFRDSFIGWVMAKANLSFGEAKQVVCGSNYNQDLVKLVGSLDIDVVIQKQEELFPIQYPPPCSFPINHPYCGEAASYLKNRGIPEQIALDYGIYFCLPTRRIIYPVMINNQCFGWQGRHIDQVDKNFKMRNNEGFARERLVMFWNRLLGSQHAIICEGPVDAIKFHDCGGNIATMGKLITDSQIKLILQPNISEIYLALDDDADREMRDLIIKLKGYQLFKIDIPESCRERCKINNKKPDFGECTFEECGIAFEHATEINERTIIVNL